MNKLHFKIKTGFGSNDFISIESDELHKAYYLFLNPDQRTIFSSGHALIGKNIVSIEPDYHKMMGWNPTWKLCDDDWTELRQKGLDVKMQNLMSVAKQIAYQAQSDKNLLGLPMNKIDLGNPHTEQTTKLAEKMRIG